jgi:cytosine/adenosine deaminase-related metal-dependent hydrolase
VVLTPHAAHTTSGALLRALGGRATAAAEPISIHVAESEDESTLLRGGAGPFAEFLRERGAWDETWRAPGLTPVEYLDRLGLLGRRTLAVHAVHLSQTDIARFQARGVTVVTCPRSNAALGVGLAPVPKLLASGIPVAIGTDSLASAPDLDMFAEVAALRESHPALAPAAALRMATFNGARALGCEGDHGGIEPGRSAMLVVVPLDDPEWDPLEVVTWNPPEVFPLEAAPWEAHAA